MLEVLPARAADPRMQALRELRAAGVKLTEEVKAPTIGALTGKTVVVTGTLLKYKRNEIEARIIELGGKTVGSVFRAKRRWFSVVVDVTCEPTDK